MFSIWTTPPPPPTSKAQFPALFSACRRSSCPPRPPPPTPPPNHNNPTPTPHTPKKRKQKQIKKTNPPKKQKKKKKKKNGTDLPFYSDLSCWVPFCTSSDAPSAADFYPRCPQISETASFRAVCSKWLIMYATKMHICQFWWNTERSLSWKDVKDICFVKKLPIFTEDVSYGNLTRAMFAPENTQTVYQIYHPGCNHSIPKGTIWESSKEQIANPLF